MSIQLRYPTDRESTKANSRMSVLRAKAFIKIGKKRKYQLVVIHFQNTLQHSKLFTDSINQLFTT